MEFPIVGRNQSLQEFLIQEQELPNLPQLVPQSLNAFRCALALREHLDQQLLYLGGPNKRIQRGNLLDLVLPTFVNEFHLR